MSRLTSRNYKNTTLELESCKPYLKLGQLEDLEEELGIDLITLFKALKDGIWSRIFGEIEKITSDENCHLVIDRNSNPEDDGFWILDYYDIRDSRGVSIHTWFINDYGKTWALTKEELE